MANNTQSRRSAFDGVTTQHVVPAIDGGWNVRKGGSLKATRHFDTKDKAEKFARELSIRQEAELFIHKRDGTIQRKDSFGRDPLPPRDRS